MNELFDLRGRVAVVTGGNGGIGYGIAQGLAQAGASLVIVGRNARKNADAVEKLAQAQRSAGVGDRAAALAIEADVTQEAACKAVIAQVADKLGRVDILVNNAGMTIRKPPQSYAIEEWHTVVNTNLASAFMCCQAAYPVLCASGGGKIINIGSMTSIFGASFAVPYSAAKGGIVQMSKALASAWAKDNIQVNAILPGWIDTDMTQQARKDVAGLNDKVLARTPAGRWGLPTDFAGVAVFLASSASDFVTGAAIPIDGGFSSSM